MRQFIVIEASDAPKPDDCGYRLMRMTGATYAENTLLDMANGMRRVARDESAEPVATVPEAVATIKRGGWTVLEVLDDTCACNCHHQAERDAMDMEEHSDCGECATALDEEAGETLVGEAKTAERPPYRNSWQDDGQDWADG